MGDSPKDDFVWLEKEDVQEHGGSVPHHQSPETVAKIHDWLQPTAYDDSTSEYLRHLISHVQGTGDWLPDTEQYRKWHSSDSHNTLWIKAVPGAGKSVLAAYQRARLSSTEKVPVLHFFFRQIITANRTPKQLVRDWLVQTMPYSTKLQLHLKERVLDQSRRLETVAFQELWDMLVDAISELPRIYCFVDALDEMSLGYEDFLVKLTTLGNSGRCKVFLTSRPVPRLVEVLRNQPVLQITLGPENMSADISVYIDHRLDHDIDRYIQHRLHTSNINLGSEETRSVIEPLVRSMLQLKAQGSFLYVRLMMDSVLHAISTIGGDVNPVWMQKILDQLPTGLSEMYAEMLKEHAVKSGTSRELQKTILQWITHSERPLRMLELAAVVDFEGGALERHKDTKAIVRTGCGPLIEIMPSDVVGPVHHSFTEYLTTKSSGSDEMERPFPPFEEKPTHRIVAELCVKYVLHCFQDAGDQPLNALKLKFPFLDYALTNWPVHVSRCGDLDDDMIKMLDGLFLKENGDMRIWKEMSSYFADFGATIRGQKRDDIYKMNFQGIGTTQMHVAATLGIDAYVSHLQALGHDVNALDELGHTPVHRAAQAGKVKCLEILLHAGADVNATGDDARTPIHLAAQGDRSEAVAVLMKHGADSLRVARSHINQVFQDELDETPLYYAVMAGHVKTVINLLQHSDPKIISAAIYHAFYRSRNDVASAILTHPRFEVDRKYRDKTPIFMAAINRDFKLIKDLLAAGASTTILSSSREHAVPSGTPQVDRETDTPLHAYTRGKKSAHGAPDHEDIRPVNEINTVIKMLVDSGCQLEALDSRGCTALQNAEADYAVASALLSQGADPKSVVRKGSYPLFRIAGCDRNAMKLWISHGLDINGCNAQGLTPLHAAMVNIVEAGIFENVKTLLELGADPNISERAGPSPLHIAVQHRRNSSGLLVKLLIGAGANVHARDQDGRTPLMCCPVDRMQSSGKLLLEAGAELDVRDCNGRTWLMNRFSEGFDPNLDKIFDLPFQFDYKALDKSGANLIHVIASKRGGTGPLKKLLDMGVDPFAVDGMGNTALHYYANSLHEDDRSDDHDVADMLLDLGVQPDKLNYMGQSIFLLAMTAGEEWVDRVRDKVNCKFDINLADVRGITPLQLAAASSETLTLKFLREGADIATRTCCGRTALHTAAFAGESEVLSILLSRAIRNRADVLNAQDDDGLTALHYAAKSGRPECVKLLLDAGADFQLLDKTKCNALAACASFTIERQQRKLNHRRYQGLASFRHARGTPTLLTKEWTDLVRGLRERRYMNRIYPQQLNIRQCVRYLIDAGSKFYWYGRLENSGEHDKFPLYSGHVRSVLDIALSSRCEPMIFEIMRELQISLSEGSRARGVPRPCERTLDIQMYEGRWRHLKFLVASEDDLEEQRKLLDILVTDDLSELILGMYKRGYNFFPSREMGDSGQSTVQRRRGGRVFDHCVFKTLVTTGRFETLRLLAQSLVEVPFSEQAVSHELWKRCCAPAPYTDGRDPDLIPNLESVRQVLMQPLDGLLLLACQRSESNLETIRIIIKHYRCSQQETMLALFFLAPAQRLWHTEAVCLLLDQGLDVNFRDPYGASPLLVACHSRWQHKSTMIKILLDRGADPNLADDDGKTCLLGAIGDVDATTILLASGADVQTFSHALLIRSIKSRDLDVLHLLISKGMALNQLGPDLVMTEDDELESGRQRAVQWECEASYPLDYAFSRMCENPWGMDSSRADQKRLRNIIKLLLENGADPFQITRQGIPILHQALENGSLSAVDFLFVPGRDFEKTDSRGRTLLLASASSGPESCGRILQMVERGCKVAAVDLEGRNFLHLIHCSEKTSCPPGTAECSRYGRQKLQEVLEQLEKETSGDELVKSLVNARDNAGCTPVHYAFARHSWKVVGILFDHGADISTSDPSGQNAFHHLLKHHRRFFSPDMEDSREMNSMIETARRDGSTAMVVRENNRKEEALIQEGQALMARALEICKSAGADINALSDGPNGEPAVFNYLRQGATYNKRRTGGGVVNVAIFESLVEKTDLDLSVRARNGQSALHVLAARSACDWQGRRIAGKPNEEALLRIWNMLVDAGLDPYAEDDEQRSALDVAAAAGNTAIVAMY